MVAAQPLPILYSALASWWPLFSPPEDYAEEAEVILTALRDTLGHVPREMLELGCGGGNIASHLAPYGRMTLVDVAPAMLAISRALNPQAEHHEGDMRTVRLGGRFDAVIIHDAIMYMTSARDLGAALATARAHLNDGGALVVLPDYVAETYAPGFEADGHDAPDGSGRGVRYMIWSHPAEPNATVMDSDFVMITREADGSVQVFHDRHHTGLFSRAAWRQVFLDAGFAEPQVRPDPWRQDTFIARPA
jgi:SAM-dependent methyltransferase